MGLCRLCAVQRKDNDVTVITDDNSDICQQLRMMCQVDIRLSDPLPKYVCRECSGMLQTLFSFCTKVQKSQESLAASFAKQDYTYSKVKHDVGSEVTVNCDEDQVSADLLQEAPRFLNLKPDRVIHNSDVSITPFKTSMSPPCLTGIYEAMTVLQDEDEKKFERLDMDVKRHPNTPVISDIRKRQCYICSKSLTSQSQEQAHMRTHTGERPFQCSICNCAFARQDSLKYHMKRHTGERPYKCSICNRAFARQDVFKIHMKRHTGERPYKCTICDCAFARQDVFKIHMKRHTGERPYMCPICDCAFARQDVLKVHMKRHPSDRPY